MKKLTSLVCTLLLLTALLAGCQTAPVEPDPDPTDDPGQTEDQTPAEPVTIRIGALTGPTVMGMVYLLDQNEQGESLNQYDLTLAASADILTPDLVRGDLDLASIPANLAAVLYQRTEGELQILAVNTLGVLYIVEAGGDAIQSIEDLRGQTIYATGKGSTPEYTLRHLLTAYGIDPDADVTIEWMSEPNEAVTHLAQGGIAMLPQPYVTVAQGQIEDLRIALDLTEEWSVLSPDHPLITGVVVARSEFTAQNPEAVVSFLTEYEASIRYVQDNIPEAAALLEQFDILKAPVAEKALPYCNITFLSGEEMKTALGGYLEVLYEANPESVGGTLPDEAFYYLP